MPSGVPPGRLGSPGTFVAPDRRVAFRANTSAGMTNYQGHNDIFHKVHRIKVKAAKEMGEQNEWSGTPGTGKMKWQTATSAELTLWNL